MEVVEHIKLSDKLINNEGFMSRFIFLFVSPIIFLNFAHGASFDCKKASTTVEKIICSDPALGKLDEVLASNYSNMGAADIGDGARNALKSTQKTWISQRNKCLDSACLASSYEKRIDEICAYPVLTGMYPDCTGSSELKPIKNIAPEKRKLETTEGKGGTSFELKGLRVGMNQSEVFSRLAPAKFVVIPQYRFAKYKLQMYACKFDCGLTVAGQNILESTLIFDQSNNLIIANFYTIPDQSKLDELIGVVTEKYGSPNYKDSLGYKKYTATTNAYPDPAADRTWRQNIEASYYGGNEPFSKMWVAKDGAIILVGETRNSPAQLVNPKTGRQITEYAISKRMTLTSEKSTEQILKVTAEMNGKKNQEEAIIRSDNLKKQVNDL